MIVVDTAVVVQNVETGLYLQQHYRTRKLIGWTACPFSCRIYRDAGFAKIELWLGQILDPIRYVSVDTARSTPAPEAQP